MADSGHISDFLRANWRERHGGVDPVNLAREQDAVRRRSRNYVIASIIAVIFCFGGVSAVKNSFLGTHGFFIAALAAIVFMVSLFCFALTRETGGKWDFSLEDKESEFGTALEKFSEYTQVSISEMARLTPEHLLKLGGHALVLPIQECQVLERARGSSSLEYVQVKTEVSNRHKTLKQLGVVTETFDRYWRPAYAGRPFALKEEICDCGKFYASCHQECLDCKRRIRRIAILHHCDRHQRTKRLAACLRDEADPDAQIRAWLAGCPKCGCERHLVAHDLPDDLPEALEPHFCPAMY